MTNRKSKGISPIIATVLLIAITIAAGLAIYGWVSGLIGAGTSTRMPGSESVTITLVSVSKDSATLLITNEGNYDIPISSANVVVQPSSGSPLSSSDVKISATTITAGKSVTVNIKGLTSGKTYIVTLAGLTDIKGDFVLSPSISFTTPSS